MEHVKELLSEYIDGKLAEADRRKVDTHLLNCQDCRLEFTELKAVTKMVGGLRSKPLPSGFMERLERRRAQEDRAGIVPPWLAYAFKSPWARPASVVLTAMVVMVVAFDRMGRLMPQRRSPASAVSVLAGASDKNSLDLKKDEAQAKTFDDARTPAVHQAPALRALEPARDRLQAQADRPIPGSAGAGGSRAYRQDAAKLPINQAVFAPTSRRAAQVGAVRGEMASNVFDVSSSAAPAAAAPAPSYLKTAAEPKGMNADLLGADMELARKKAADGMAAESAQARQSEETSSFKEKSLSRPAKATAAKEEYAIRSTAELREVWAELGLSGTMPIVDFDGQILLLIRGSAKFTEIRQENDRILVNYRKTSKIPVDDSNEPPFSYRMISTSPLPVVFQKQP